MALAVAMVACQGAVGEPGQSGQPGQPGGVPPRSIEAIQDVSLMLAGPMATKAIDVTNNFDDPDAEVGDSLIVTATSSKETIVTASVSGMMVTVTAVALGEADVTVTVTDKDSLTAKDTFKVTVAPSIAPELIEELPNVWMGTDYASHEIDLTDHFFHSSEIAYSAMPQDNSIATATIEGTVLTVASADTGITRVVVTATADGQSTTDGFQVEVEDHPVRGPYEMGTLDNIELTVGESEVVDVAGNFADPDDQALTLHAYSDDEDLATVDVDGSMITVTAVGAGSTVITAYVRDDDDLRSDDLWFEVTVSDPDPDPDPDPDEGNCDVLDVGDTCTVPVEDGQTVVSGDTNKLTVSETSANTFTVTAKAKGDASVQIRDADDLSLIERIDIHVNNQAPLRKAMKDPTSAMPLAAAADADIPSSYSRPDDAAMVTGDGEGLHKFTIMWSDYFEDKDGDTLTYKARSSNSQNAVVAAVNGTTVLVDILNNEDNTVEFTFTAKDNDEDDPKESVDSLTYRVQLMAVNSRTYNVTQFTGSGTDDFDSPIAVGYRTVAEHELVFTSGFAFAADVDGAGDSASTITNACSAITTPADGAECFEITKSGSIVLGTLAAEGGNLGVPFTLTGFTDPTITVTYRRWDDNTATPPVPTLTQDMRTLQLNVVPVVE